MNSRSLPNSVEFLKEKLARQEVPMRRVWGMLALRSALTFGLLLCLAAVFKLTGSQSAVLASSAWWLWFVTLTNLASIALMLHFGRLEGVRLSEMYFFDRSTWKGDLLWLLIFMAITAVIAMPPGTMLARALWGDPNFPNALLFQPLPAVAVYPLILLMPTSQALAELPIYWGYVAPRLQASGLNRWLVIGLVGSVLSVQHLFFSFQLDWRFDLWLAVKFLPFALWTGIVVDRRPTALPYLMFVHFLIDASLPLLALMTSRGMPLG